MFSPLLTFSSCLSARTHILKIGYTHMIVGKGNNKTEGVSREKRKIESSYTNFFKVILLFLILLKDISESLA